MIEPSNIEPHIEDVEDYNPDYLEKPQGWRYTDQDDVNAQDDQDMRDDLADLAYTNRSRCDGLSRLRRNPLSLIVCFMVLVALLFVSYIAGVKPRLADGRSSNGSSGNDVPTHQQPVQVDPDTVDPQVAGKLLGTLVATYERNNLDPSVLTKNLPGGLSPQKKAFHWLATDDQLDQFEHTELIQRYALAVFYYATNAVPTVYIKDPQPWKEAHHWLSEQHSCEWMGIVCNDLHHVIAIDLEKNHLSGSLPPELALIKKHLITLDLTSNFIYMHGDHFDVLGDLKHLTTLLMDDNYLHTEDGLPWQLKHLHRLEKLRLSYNLMGGPLAAYDEVLSDMGKLTHLELESNFFNGTMPEEINKLTNLVYLYLRRNEMSFNLDAIMKHPKLTKLFALWLDGNHMTGSIPSGIGNFTNLASISLTNSTLTGSIPTEIGLLTGLRRLWLYSNELTGTIPQEVASLPSLEVFEIHHNQIGGGMPSGICNSIENSEYAYKSLTSDCGKVHCHGCCTQCF